ncbi:hypothetical protein CBL_13923 [Carabus blaptoides fortunei]
MGVGFILWVPVINLSVNVELEIACPLVDRRLKSTDIVRSLSLLAWGLQKCFLNDQATCTVPTLCACCNRRLAIRGPEDNTFNATLEPMETIQSHDVAQSVCGGQQIQCRTGAVILSLSVYSLSVCTLIASNPSPVTVIVIVPVPTYGQATDLLMLVSPFT